MKRKQIMDTFSKKLSTNFEDYCNRHDEEKGIDEFITYVLDQELISDSVVRKYAILQAFDDLSAKNEGNKTKYVTLLAERFNVSERSIWNVLRKNKH